MENGMIVKALTALAQSSRLEIFRLLVVAGPSGMTPGRLTELLGVPANTLSFHLKELINADLANVERQGRHLVYRAQYDRMNQVVSYLTENCCAGQACELVPDRVHQLTY